MFGLIFHLNFAKHDYKKKNKLQFYVPFKTRPTPNWVGGRRIEGFKGSSDSFALK